MPIEFPDTTLQQGPEKKVSVFLNEATCVALQDLQQQLGLKSQTDTIEWCVVQVLKEAIESGKIAKPDISKFINKAV